MQAGVPRQSQLLVPLPPRLLVSLMFFNGQPGDSFQVLGRDDNDTVAIGHHKIAGMNQHAANTDRQIVLVELDPSDYSGGGGAWLFDSWPWRISMA